MFDCHDDDINDECHNFVHFVYDLGLHETVAIRHEASHINFGHMMNKPGIDPRHLLIEEGP